jgi:hypothetical protein
MHSVSIGWLRRLVIIPAIGLVVTACGSVGPSAPGATATVTAAPTTSTISASPSEPQGAEPSPAEAQTVEPSPTDSAATEPPGGTTSGDVPDNAVFLTYKGANPGFSIQYVEGWQVTPQADGVVIKDKDSSETVAIVAAPADVAAFVASTDLPALQAQPGFKLIKQDTVKVGGTRYVHLVFHQKSPPDSVTGKEVPQTVDRYYVPGPKDLAVVSLATPDGVDNVDAFRQMIESFTWP